MALAANLFVRSPLQPLCDKRKWGLIVTRSYWVTTHADSNVRHSPDVQ